MAGQSATFRDDEADDGADDAPAGVYPSNAPAMERGGNVSLLSEFNRPAPGEEPRAPRTGAQEAEENYEVVDVDDAGRPVGGAREREAPVTQDDDDTYVQRQQRETAQRGIDARRARDQVEAEKLGLTLRQYKRHQERQGRDRSRSEIARLQAELSQVTQRLQSVVEPRLAEMQEGRLRQSVADLDRQRQELLSRANTEMRAFTQATLAQDEDGMARALAARDQAIMQATRLEAQRNMLATGNPQGIEQAGGQPYAGQPQRAPQQAAGQEYDAATQRLAAEFKEDHPWINFRQAYVNGVVQEVPADQDTEILSAIDKRVMQDGFRPNTVAYWDELERRAAMYLPHRFIQEQGDAGQVEPPQRQAAPRREAPQQRREAVPPSAQRRGPPVAGGNENAGGAGNTNRVYLSPGRKEALMLAGAMDNMGRISNRDTYNKYMRSYAKYDRENNVLA